ncbi:MAG: ParA family protein [Clostridium sp.]
MIITVSNQKGGVGKTTTSAALAAGLSMAGKKVLCIDLDPQGNLGFCMGLDTEAGYTVLDALKGKVPVENAVIKTELCDILSSDITLSSSGLEELCREHRESILKNTLRPILSMYDYVVIDTPPALNLLTVNAYTVSDYLIIPMASDILSLVGLSQLRETVETVRGQLNPGLKVMGILLTRYNKRTCLARDVQEMAEQLAKQINTKVFESKIRSGVAIAEAPAHGESIFTYNPRSAAVKDYQEFIREVAGIIGM